MENFYKGVLILGTVVLMFASTGIKFERTIDSGIGFGHTGNEKIAMKMDSKSAIRFGHTGAEKIIFNKMSPKADHSFGRTGAEKAAMKSNLE